MRVYSVEDINNIWSCERIIELLDETRFVDAKALAHEWGYSMDDGEDQIPPQWS